MAITTVDVRYRSGEDGSLVDSWSFTYNPGAITVGVRGIALATTCPRETTEHGLENILGAERLVFSTTHTLVGFVARTPRLLFVDPDSHDVVDEVATSGRISTSDDLMDITWMGNGFYGIRYIPGGGGSAELVYIEPTGVCHLVAALTNQYSRGIAFDGINVYVNRGVGAPAVAVVEARTAGDGAMWHSGALSTACAANGGGICWKDGALVEKADPVLNAVRFYVHYLDVIGGGNEFWTLGADNATEQAPLAFNGVDFVEFDSDN